MEKDNVKDLKVEDVVIPEKMRTKCEVWSRPVGYLRPVHLYNKGKKQEYDERINFKA